jgi:hypothetical protein
MEPNPTASPFRAGQEVEVRQRYTSDWATGFQVDEVDLSGAAPEVWLRRHSDGARLPAWFTVDEVRGV